MLNDLVEANVSFVHLRGGKTLPKYNSKVIIKLQFHFCAIWNNESNEYPLSREQNWNVT